MNMLEQVIFLLDGEYVNNNVLCKGALPVHRPAFQDVYWRWEADRLTATDCLAIVHFAIYGMGNPDESAVVDAWSAELRTAAETGEIKARNPATLLPFKALPDGWDWLVSIDDCDKLLKARGLDWQISTVVEHIAGLLFHMPTNEAAATSGAQEKAAAPETPTERKQRIVNYVNSAKAQGRTKKSAFAELAVIEGCKVDNINRLYYDKDAKAAKNKGW